MTTIGLQSIVFVSDFYVNYSRHISFSYGSSFLRGGNLAKEPLLLTMNYLNDYDQFEVAVKDVFFSGLRRHHALDDAKANRWGWFAAGGDIMKSIQVG